MNYILNVEVAVKYGVDEAIMLENIVFWIRKNQANNKHFYDGEYCLGGGTINQVYMNDVLRKY